MLRYWKRALGEFPASASAPGIQSFAIYPFRWSETPVLQQTFGEGADMDHVVGLAREFLHEDYAYEAQLNWNRWVQKPREVSGRRHRIPAAVSLVCLGPEFDREGLEQHCDLQINFGLDSAFLPTEEEWALSGAGPNRDLASLWMRENVRQLWGFVRQLEKKLPLAKKLLWCESGENLAEKILSVWKLES